MNKHHRFRGSPAKIPGCVLWLPTDMNNQVPASGMAAQIARVTTEYLSVASNATLQTGDVDFEISCWAYRESVAVEPAMIVAKSTVGAYEYRLFWDNVSDRFTFDVSHDGTTLKAVLANTLGAPVNATWYFLKVWHNATLNTLNIQVNNGAIDSVAHSLGVFVGTTELRIGRMAGQNNWDGRIQDVRFSKNGIPVSYWPLNEPAGTRFDQIGTNHLTDNNTVTTNPGAPTVLNAASGLQDQGPYKFVSTISPEVNRPLVRQSPAGRDVLEYDNATDRYISFPDHPALRLLTGSHLAAWVRSTMWGTNCRLVDKAVWGWINSANNVSYGGVSYNVASALPFAVLLPINTWLFLEAWQDATGAVTHAVNFVTIPNAAGTAALPVTGTGVMKIGNSSGTANRSFPGQIGDFFIADRPLTITERRTVFNASAWKYGVNAA